MNRKKLPIGIQTFADMVSRGYYYVDKTGMIADLIESGKHFFLARPRRFGKSLLVDTIKAVFEGRQALFAGLAIETRRDWQQIHPVLKLSFGDGHWSDVAALAAGLGQQLAEAERAAGLTPQYTDVRARLRDLLVRLHAANGCPVVVLVDEYDKPILDCIDQPERARAMRELLKNVYSVLKDLDDRLRFVLLTGVSKFSKVSLFSGLNNLNDITLDARWSALCGYTEAEVDQVFAAECVGLDRAEMKRWYNGYNWLGEAVYNPFDLLLLFDKRRFLPWWSETGTPEFLTRLLLREGFFTPDLRRLVTGAGSVSSFEIERIRPEALLFQAGYLTIKEARQTLGGQWTYTLGYPNHEVAMSLNSALLDEFSGDAMRAERYRIELDEILASGDATALVRCVSGFLAGIPYPWSGKTGPAKYEGYWASVFYSWLAALGYEIRVEEATHRGRIDLVLLHPYRIWLFEFKVAASAGEALAQIRQNGYADKFRAHGLPMVWVGLRFSPEEKNVVEFQAESVDVAN